MNDEEVAKILSDSKVYNMYKEDIELKNSFFEDI